MTAASAASDRLTAWEAAFELYGYEPEEIRDLTTGFEIVHATRPATHGDPTIVVDVDELWLPDPDPLQGSANRSYQAAFLSKGSAHAQIEPGDIGADRIDVGDPSKPPSLTIHRHPFGQPNHVRVPLSAIPVPAQWVHELEEIAADLAGAWGEEDV